MMVACECRFAGLQEGPRSREAVHLDAEEPETGKDAIDLEHCGVDGHVVGIAGQQVGEGDANHRIPPRRVIEHDEYRPAVVRKCGTSLGKPHSVEMLAE